MNKFLFFIIINFFFLNSANSLYFELPYGIIEYNQENMMNSNIFNLELKPLENQDIEIDLVWNHLYSLKSNLSKTVIETHFLNEILEINLSNWEPLLNEPEITFRAINIAQSLQQFHFALTRADLLRFNEIRCISLERYILNINYVEFTSICAPLSKGIINMLYSKNNEVVVNYFNKAYIRIFSDIETIVSEYNDNIQHAGPINPILANALELGDFMNCGVFLIYYIYRKKA